MRSRLLAGAALLLSALLASLAISFWIAARLLQALIVVSIAYVAYLAWRGFRTIRAARRATPVEGERPWITVVVPARNEAPVIGGILTDLAVQDYGDGSGARFDVLVIDDGSTDETAALATAAAGRLGERFRIVHRPAGSGPRTKGAVLAFGHDGVRGEVIAVLDADSRVARDYLARAVGAWRRDPAAAALQTRRTELNAGRGWLPAAQEDEQRMDLASQCGRWATDGTAELRGTGMFVRRAALERVGGWDVRAITEDLELSTRLALAGEHVTLAPEAVVREEAVETLPALWRQRMRWAEGSMRRLIDLGPAVLAARRLPAARRLDFLLFVTEFLVPPLFVATVAASLLTVVLPRGADWTVPATLFVGYGLGTFLLAAAGLAATGIGGWPLLGRATRGSLFLSHWLLVVPIALMRITFGSPTTEFAQTPRSRHRDP